MDGLRTFLGAVSLSSLLCCAAFCQSNAGFTIAGAVVQEGTNQPMNRVLVTISEAQHGEHNISAVTGADGHFSFAGVPAGKYALSAEVGNAPAQSFHQDGLYSTAIVTGPNQDTEYIVFPLEQLSSISGTVVDEQGEPVRTAQVYLFRNSVFDGRETMQQVGQNHTDAAGEFYWGHLQPGTYLIAVEARPWYAQQQYRLQQRANAAAGQANVPSEMNVAYPVTYSGGGTDPDSAPPIRITAANPAHVQIALNPVPVVRISFSDAAAQGTNSIGIRLAAIGPDGRSLPVHIREFHGNSHQREIVEVAPGKYLLTASRFRLTRSNPGGLGKQKIEVSGDMTLDVDSLPKSVLSGTLSFDGARPPRGQPSIFLRGKANGQTNNSLRVGTDGSLITMGAVEPGQYKLQLIDLTGYYLKSVAVKGGSYSGGVLTIPENGPVQLTLVAASGTFNVDGVVLQNGHPMAGAMVLLLAQSSNSCYIPRDQSDSGRSFTLRDVPPGKYTAVAIDDGRDLPYADPEVMKPYLAAGQAVSVPLQNEAKLQVEVQARRK